MTAPVKLSEARAVEEVISYRTMTTGPGVAGRIGFEVNGQAFWTAHYPMVSPEAWAGAVQLRDDLVAAINAGRRTLSEGGRS